LAALFRDRLESFGEGEFTQGGFILFKILSGATSVRYPLPTLHMVPWIRRIKRTLCPIVAFLGKWPSIIASLPSIYLLIAYPPLWKDVDAVSQLLRPASELNILHFPPIYCFLGRIPFVLTAWIDEGGHKPLHSLLDEQLPPLAGFYLLVIIQHLLLIAALTYVVTVITQNRTQRCLFAGLLASASALYTHAQCCGSEALSVPSTIAVLTAGLSIARGSRQTSWIIYGIALFLAIGSRQINLLLAFWLPLTLACLSLATRIRWCNLSTKTKYWRGAMIAVAVGVAAIGLNRGITQLLIASVHDDYRSTLGRTLSDRIATFLDKLPAKERLQLAEDLAAGTIDPEVKIAILAQATAGSFYQGSSLTLANQLSLLAPPGTNIAAERDRVVLTACMRYLLTMHPLLMNIIWQDFVKASFSIDNARIALSPFYANAYPALDKTRSSGIWDTKMGLEALPSIGAAQATLVLNRARHDRYILLWRNVPLGAFMILGIFFAGQTCVLNKQIPTTVLVGLSALATGIAIVAANCVCVYYMPRYTLPLLTTILFALVTCLASFAESRFLQRYQREPL
jgi:hypothetical protein